MSVGKGLSTARKAAEDDYRQVKPQDQSERPAARRPCYFVLALYGWLAFGTMFIWPVTACGISLLLALDGAFFFSFLVKGFTS